jgi:ParB family chromosome partitioning protein
MSKEKAQRTANIKMIDVDRINILNPRVRNQKTFFDIASNITKVGLKKPITVMPCKSGTGGKDYDLVCGQGRLEAFMACGQKEIPALVIDASEEQALIMSLVENLARRQHRAADLMQGVEVLRKQGYDASAIAGKTGLSPGYVQGVLDLMEKGEERLVAAVETGHMSLSLAIQVANSPGDEQHALQEAYETKQLRGQKLLVAKRLLDTRRRHGKSFTDETGRKRYRSGSGDKKLSAQAILNAYKRDVNRKKLLARRAHRTSQSLLFVKEALRDLLKEEPFRNLLQAEKLLTLPKPLADFMAEKGDGHG